MQERREYGLHMAQIKLERQSVDQQQLRGLIPMRQGDYLFQLKRFTGL